MPLTFESCHLLIWFVYWLVELLLCIYHKWVTPSVTDCWLLTLNFNEGLHCAHTIVINVYCDHHPWTWILIVLSSCSIILPYNSLHFLWPLNTPYWHLDIYLWFTVRAKCSWKKYKFELLQGSTDIVSHHILPVWYFQILNIQIRHGPSCIHKRLEGKWKLSNFNIHLSIKFWTDKIHQDIHVLMPLYILWKYLK